MNRVSIHVDSLSQLVWAILTSLLTEIAIAAKHLKTEVVWKSVAFNPIEKSTASLLFQFTPMFGTITKTMIEMKKLNNKFSAALAFWNFLTTIMAQHFKFDLLPCFAANLSPFFFVGPRSILALVERRLRNFTIGLSWSCQNTILPSDYISA
jgi:hypothetical protein